MTRSAVRIYDLASTRPKGEIELKAFPWVKWLSLKCSVQVAIRRNQHLGRALFLRGMDLTEDLLWVGISPASILCIDWRRKRLVDVFRHSSDLMVCVHGLKVLPS